MLLVDELPLEFHCALQLQDRSLNVNGTFMSGGIIPSSYTLGGSLAESLRFAGVQHAAWKEVSYKVSEARNVEFFQYKGWLRTWQVKLCGTTVAVVGCLHDAIVAGRKKGGPQSMCEGTLL